jgi:hypothetical protein
VTLFIRLLDTSVDKKGEKLRAAIAASNTGAGRDDVFTSSLEEFGKVPNTPFAYWLSPSMREVFVRVRSFEYSERTVKQGLITTDDARFVRAWWEVASRSTNQRWFSFAKGGAYSPFYADIPVVVDWLREGAQSRAIYEARHEVVGGIIKNPEYYFRAGLTWPLRGVRFSAQAVGKGSIFSVGGKMAFAPHEDLIAYLALFNSRLFDYLIGVSAGKVGGVQYEVGLIQRVPVPELCSTDVAKLGELGRLAWLLKRQVDTGNETSHAFVMPCTCVATDDGERVEQELARLQTQIDDVVFELFAISEEDRMAIEVPKQRETTKGEDAESTAGSSLDLDDEERVEGAGPETLCSWMVGVAFARFDPRLATGERPVPPEPEPFDPLPSRSPGMYPAGEEPADRPDVLVDDEGHPNDLTARALDVAELVKVDVPNDLRAWYAKEFFPFHIKMYSKSNRKAPIYWQLATPSASYSVWLYLHAFTPDTMVRVANDYVAPKLAIEEERLERLRAEAAEGSSAQRKAFDAQARFVDELRAFLEEVRRVAPLWNPDLDDGVILNFAPLWRLVPQHKAWQKEVKAKWDELCEGKYDWAHLAMHLWPERVVPKCADDRSFAIAHGLEDVFWFEDDKGKWHKRPEPTRPVAELVAERTSPTVKAALKALLDAPAPTGGKAKKKSTKKAAR